MRADLEHGWRRRKKTYGFSGQAHTWYRGDFKFRTQLNVLPQPSTFSEEAATFPDISIRRNSSKANYKIEQKILSVTIPLNQPWQVPKGKRPFIYFTDAIELGETGLWVGVSALVVFHPPQRAPIPDAKAWCQKLFVPGGQFESNRRGH